MQSQERVLSSKLTQWYSDLKKEIGGGGKWKKKDQRQVKRFLEHHGQEVIVAWSNEVTADTEVEMWDASAGGIKVPDDGLSVERGVFLGSLPDFWREQMSRQDYNLWK